MSDEILSEDELAALLESIGDDPDGGAREKVIVDYDFARPDKLNSEQIRSLQRIHESVAQELSNVLSRNLRMNIEVVLVSIGQLSFDVFRNSLANPTVIQVLTMPDRQHPAVLTVDSKLSLSLIDSMLGGAGQALPNIRPLTSVEHTVLDNVTGPLIRNLREGWRRMGHFDFQVAERESDPGFLQVIPAGEMVLVATFSLQSVGEIEPGELCICIPFLDLEDAIAKLTSQGRFADIRREQTSADRVHLDKVVAETQVGLRIDMGTSVLTIQQILDLKADDILVLDQTTKQPLVGYVEDKPKILCHPGRLRRKNGIIVDEVLPDDE